MDKTNLFGLIRVYMIRHDSDAGCATVSNRDLKQANVTTHTVLTSGTSRSFM